VERGPLRSPFGFASSIKYAQMEPPTLNARAVSMRQASSITSSKRGSTASRYVSQWNARSCHVWMCNSFSHSRRYWSRLYPADRHSHQRLRSLCRLCNRSTRKHGSHLCPVFLRAVDIRNQLQSVRRVTRSISNRCLVQFLTNKARLDIVGAGRLDRCSRDHHAGRCAGAISIQRNNRRASIRSAR